MDSSSPLPTPEETLLYRVSLRHTDAPSAFDSRVCRRVNRWGGSRGIRGLFRIVSKLGDGWIWYALMLALPVCLGTRGLRAGLQMLCTGLLAWQLYRLLKRRTRRPRPYRAHPEVVAHVPPLDEYSFPSGHTLHAVSFSMVAVAWVPALLWPLLAFTVLVAASRVLLGLHYPSDVLAGALLGALVGAGSLWGYFALFGAIA